MTNALHYVVRQLSSSNNNNSNSKEKSKDIGLGLPVPSTTNAQGEIDLPKNIDALKKYFLQMLDRLDKGARLPVK